MDPKPHLNNRASLGSTAAQQQQPALGENEAGEG